MELKQGVEPTTKIVLNDNAEIVAVIKNGELKVKKHGLSETELEFINKNIENGNDPL